LFVAIPCGRTVERNTIDGHASRGDAITSEVGDDEDAAIDEDAAEMTTSFGTSAVDSAPAAE
jgi:hypothetical protein